jgi:hypothetical protein
MNPHRVHEPRHADQGRVRGDEQDRGRQQADIRLAGLLQWTEIDLLDHAEDRVARVAAFLLREAEQRLVFAGRRVLHHRQGR